MIRGPKYLVNRAKLFASILGVPEDLEIIIKLKNTGGWSGEAAQLGDNFYELVLFKKLKKFQQTEVLAHEMVHVAQYVSGDLKDPIPSTSGQYMWKGKEVYIREGDMDDYFLSPWELEARALEAFLVHKWEHR